MLKISLSRFESIGIKRTLVKVNLCFLQGRILGHCNRVGRGSDHKGKPSITGVRQLLELDQENSIYSISFCNIVLILYRYENLCIWMYLLVEFSSFSSLQFTIFVFQFTIWKKRSSNLKMSINFGKVLYLNELSYHTLIGCMWKSKINSLKWDQSGYGSFIRLDFTVFQR